MGKLMLESLELIDAIDRRGSFSAAGEELHKVQSTISYTVAKMEEDLKVSLFRRNGPRIEITEAGRELLREGRLLLQAAADLECRVQRVASGWESSLQLALDGLIPTETLASIIAAFHEVTDATQLCNGDNLNEVRPWMSAATSCGSVAMNPTIRTCVPVRVQTAVPLRGRPISPAAHGTAVAPTALAGFGHHGWTGSMPESWARLRNSLQQSAGCSPQTLMRAGGPGRCPSLCRQMAAWRPAQAREDRSRSAVQPLLGCG